MITLTTTSYITYKEQETIDDCQDAKHENVELGRFAVADGATRSFFPKIWAELLVKNFCVDSFFSFDRKNWKEWLYPIQQEWYHRVEERVKAQNLFYLTNSFNAKDAAVSTFIGVEIDKTKGKWQAMIIGDSCLFNKTASGFNRYLLEKSEDFTNLPETFVSYADKNQFTPVFKSGEIQSGDMLILTTDALAKWILEHYESGDLENILTRLEQINSDEQFNHFVNQARYEDVRLDNDDVTLMLISMEESRVSVKNENSQVIPSENYTAEKDKPRVNMVEVIIWGLIAGVVGIWALNSTVSFIHDLVLTLLNKN